MATATKSSPPASAVAGGGNRQRQDTAGRSRQMTPAAHQPGTEQVSVAAIRADGGTQMRAALNTETVTEYAEAMQTYGGWGKFEPIEVYYDGTAYWLADGFHRLAAAKEAGIETASAKVHSGDRRAAILHAAGANADHGLRRTNADKRRAVEMMLRDQEWGLWSQADIARHCRVTPEYVSRLKKELSIDRSIDSSKTVTRGGATYQMDTANIGRKEQPEPVRHAPAPTPEPDRRTPSDLIAAGYEIQPSTNGRYRWVNADGEIGDTWDLDNAIADARKRIELTPPAPTPADRGILTDDWIAHILARANPVSADFETALNVATPEQVRDALLTLSTEDSGHEQRYARLRGRLDGIEGDDGVDYRKLARVMAEKTEYARRVRQDLELPAPTIDPLVAKLIDRTTPIHTTDETSLLALVRSATDAQLQEALRLLPENMQTGRGPVLMAALKKRGASVPETEPTPIESAIDEAKREEVAPNKQVDRLARAVAFRALLLEMEADQDNYFADEIKRLRDPLKQLINKLERRMR